MKRAIVIRLLTVCGILNMAVGEFSIGAILILFVIVYAFFNPPTDTPSDPHPEHQMD